MSVTTQTKLPSSKRTLAHGSVSSFESQPLAKKRKTLSMAEDDGDESEYLPSESEEDEVEEVKKQWNVEKRLGKKTAEHFVRVNQFYNEVIAKRKELIKKAGGTGALKKSALFRRLNSILRTIVALTGHDFTKRGGIDVLPKLSLATYKIVANREIFLGIMNTWFGEWIAEGADKDLSIATKVAKRETYIWILHLYESPTLEKAKRPTLDFVPRTSINKSRETLVYLMPSLTPTMPAGCRAARQWFSDVRDKFVSLFEQTATAYESAPNRTLLYRLIGMMDIYKR